MALLKARAARVPRRPTRTGAKTAVQTSRPVKDQRSLSHLGSRRRPGQLRTSGPPPAYRLTEFPGFGPAALALKRQGLTSRAMTGDAGEIG